jgi:glycosyltransferase involved in cell wall biosynthesis
MCGWGLSFFRWSGIDGMKLSVVMATMNEEGAVANVIGEALRYGAPWGPEVVVVDSSADRTAEIASGLGARVIRQEAQGHGTALRTGMLAAEGDVILTTDCDETYPMDHIPRFMELIEKEGYDAVSGRRILGENQAMPLANRMANWVFAALVRLLYRIPTHDVTTGMHALRKDVVRSIPWKTNYSFPAELIVRTVQRSYKWREIDIPYRERTGEVTLNRFRSGRAYVGFIVGHRFRRERV